MDNETSAQELERKEKPLNDLLTSAMVSIYVGPENTHWYIHERLLCYYSPFFADIFYANDKSSENQKARRNKAYGLPDEEDLAFEMLVGWLYSRDIKVPKEEKDIGPLLDLYLLSDKLCMERLCTELVEAISDYYYRSQTYPSLRRVQHVYSNTDDDNEMREMMVGAVAKLLTTSEKIPAHWASALQRNGQLAVDIIRSIQQWKLEEKSIPDARDRSSSRGRSAKNGFSAIERQNNDSVETEKTSATSNLGVESLNSDNDQSRDQSMQDSSQLLKSDESEASPPPNYSNLNSPTEAFPSSPQTFTTPNPDTNSNDNDNGADPPNSPLKPKKPPDTSTSTSTSTNHSISPRSITETGISRRRLSVTFANEVTYRAYTFFPSPLATNPIPTEIKEEVPVPAPPMGLAITTVPTQPTRSISDDAIVRAVEPTADKRGRALSAAKQKPEAVVLGFLWLLYLGWLAGN